MRIAIISDIHGNLPALEATLDDVRAQAPDELYCLGDLVGYGASPNEVVARIRAEKIPTIMGNYDDGVGFDRDECGCAYRDEIDRELGQRSLAWTKQHTTDDHKAFLRTCLPQIRFEMNGVRVLLVHGSPRKMNEYLFEDRPLSSFERIAASSQADIIVFGHTHVPYVKDVQRVRFINAGSVGKPKDKDPRAGYLILDRVGTTAAGTDPIESQVRVTFRRVEYDVARAATAIRQSGLPAKFARDIEQGGAEASRADLQA